ncbi:hypothetical protein ULMS_07870 [Patiriisocius marinistellae]|uniref:Gliding motility protein RemB n=1 Tax=Patiriisocius marinistellae TaxID=2494560 RepID=A0A5J4FYN3_9FLAO|nr:gliding motility protein RemB [Patiriisocius marinistellae]GEQ85279.1 hypothetical protein ULMS_07870 [Patiriisocius marinistellae]
MKPALSLLFSLIALVNFGQTPANLYEKYPVFPACVDQHVAALETCFFNEVQNHIFNEFNVPAVVSKENYNGAVNIFFEVDKEGIFKVLYVDAIYQELIDETNRVFSTFQKIAPATFNGEATYVQFTMPLSIPLKKPTERVFVSSEMSQNQISQNIENPIKPKEVETVLTEYDDIKKFPYNDPLYESNINIPLSHHEYGRFDAAMNRVGTNNHTAQKPYIYNEVNKYYNFKEKKEALLFDNTSWFGRKLWNENMVRLQGEDYWLTLDPGVDLQAGKDIDDDINTYNNTRLVYAQGGLGKHISFFAVVYESQGRFAGYYNRYAESIRPDGGNPAIIPGRGIAKAFRSDSYDYPIATGHVSYSPSKWFNVQLGHGKNFIGDGYRSLLLSDNASPYPFIKLNTTFWKIKYTNTWMSLRDVRPEVTDSGSFRTKYMANHYLSYNVTKRWNIGLFETVIWENDNDRGFDFNYINPVIFYRAIEFSTGSRGGNAVIGLSTKYKFTDKINAYGQLIIDEFSSSDIFGGNGSYKNKTGYQLGLKYFDAFGVKDLMLQAEYNRVRPFTYSHNSITLNYGHNNQSMAHTLGANFSEFIAIARYNRGRIFGDIKLITAKRGLEFDKDTNPAFFGGDIYGTEDVRRGDLNNELGQGNTTQFFHAELQAGYLINPSTNLKIYGSMILRDFDTEVQETNFFDENTTWVNFGVRTDLFNWYNDF